MAERRLVIVGGAPATGKTTLARVLGQALALPVLTKDDVKEALAEPFETGDREWSKRLGSAAYEVLFAVAARMLETGPGLVLESNFTRTRSEERLRTLVSHARTCVVVCRVRDEVRRRRFEERAASRHRAHVDTAILADWSEDDADFLIDLDVARVVVDTTSGYRPDIEQLVSFASGSRAARPSAR